MRKVDSNVYDKEYFLNAVEGFQNFDNLLQKVNPKYKQALKVAKLNEGEKVLDIGCGRGEMTIYSHIFHGCDSTGIDYSKDAIAIANGLKEKTNKVDISKVKFLHVDTNTLPFETESFDVIFFMDVWEHIYPEQMDILIKEFHRVLKKEGRLIVHTCPNKIFFDVGFPKYTYYFNYILNKFIFRPIKGRDMARSKRNPRSHYELTMHVNEQTKDSLQKTLSRNNFQAKVFINDYFVMLSSPIMFFYYFIAQPFFIPYLGNIFGEHLWAVGLKK